MNFYAFSQFLDWIFLSDAFVRWAIDDGPAGFPCAIRARAGAQPYIGVNYGEVADNLPLPEETARLLKSTAISKVRLYGVDAGLIRALAGSNISVVVGVANGDIPSLAADPTAASRWLAANVLQFIPATAISAVGGHGGEAPLLLYLWEEEGVHEDDMWDPRLLC